MRIVITALLLILSTRAFAQDVTVKLNGKFYLTNDRLVGDSCKSNLSQFDKINDLLLTDWVHIVVPLLMPEVASEDNLLIHAKRRLMLRSHTCEYIRRSLRESSHYAVYAVLVVASIRTSTEVSVRVCKLDE